eukprot:TRINITY_DN10081_c0_g1_i8.p1 TRINITY_DN10081_c0_g1~~TRINITY_DN10081_c0_g1_i8.p1  ORF type:complete len:271 (+),score=35.06 TRINITY_DN10081_c0_g1_i8:42-815(+)
MMVLDMTPKVARLQSQHDPYATAQFRTDIDQLIAKGDLVEIGLRELKDSADGRTTGKVWEYANAWLAPDFISTSDQPTCFTTEKKGRLAYVRTHNSVINIKFANSPDKRSQMVVESIRRVGEKTLEARLSLVITILSRVIKVKRIHAVAVYNNQYQVSSLTCNMLTPLVVSPLQICYLEDGSVQPPTLDRPCAHNSWDLVRTKKGVALLRCRTCVSQWKLSIFDVSKCKKFYSDEGCPKGDSCRHLHVHARKKCQAL